MVRSSHPRVVGAGSALVGLLLVLSLLLFMNRKAPPPDGDDGLTGSSIAVVRNPPPKPQEQPPRREPPKRKLTRSAPAPLLGFESGLAGASFGLPGLDASELDLGDGLLGDSKDVVMTDDSVDVAPRPLVQTPMTYPARAKSSGVTGYVLLSVLIGPTGRVEQVKVLESQPAGVFDDTAVAGVQAWKFEPASYKGENVRVWARQRVRFDLS